MEKFEIEYNNFKTYISENINTTGNGLKDLNIDDIKSRFSSMSGKVLEDKFPNG
jgi:hypothetical protein